MSKKAVKLFLNFPPEMADKPLTYYLIKDYDLVFNILQAEITGGKKGRLTMELIGEPEDIEKGIAFIERQNVQVRVFTTSILWNEERCVACGTCTAVCPSGAIAMNAQTDWRLQFQPDRCLVCEACVKACPLKAMDVDVFA